MRARLLVAIENLPTRDGSLKRIATDNADSSRALWTDLTRRAPHQVRTPAATLLAFFSWLSGDGADAWVPWALSRPAAPPLSREPGRRPAHR
jgi:hypothetical protein